MARDLPRTPTRRWPPSRRSFDGSCHRRLGRPLAPGPEAPPQGAGPAGGRRTARRGDRSRAPFGHRVHQGIKLVRFAAQPQQQHARCIGIVRKPRQQRAGADGHDVAAAAGAQKAKARAASSSSLSRAAIAVARPRRFGDVRPADAGIDLGQQRGALFARCLANRMVELFDLPETLWGHMNIPRAPFDSSRLIRAVARLGRVPNRA